MHLELSDSKRPHNALMTNQPRSRRLIQSVLEKFCTNALWCEVGTSGNVATIVSPLVLSGYREELLEVGLPLEHFISTKRGHGYNVQFFNAWNSCGNNRLPLVKSP